MEGPRTAPITIDFFLRALAKDQQQRAVGVILSGTGSDGTLGVKAIKLAGGLVLAQDSESAEHTGMPDSAISSGVVDQVLSPEEIPEALIRFAQHAYIREEMLSSHEKTASSSPESDHTDDKEESLDDTEKQTAGLSDIIGLLSKQANCDFQKYKEATLLRRTQRRMCLHHVDTIDDYLNMLKADADEVTALAKDLLISVTDFFRDREVWDNLAKKVIPEIVRSKSNDESIRCWVAGCATGEEAYTVAILILDELSRQRRSNPLQIFASDIDKAALEQARSGRYPISIAADVSPQQLKRYFSLEDGDLHYQVNKSLREAVVFADQNLISDPPFSQLQLVCCRNVMIYLKPDVQQKLMGLFHFALIEGGYLLLGTAETVGRQDDIFETISKRHRIYQAIGPTRHDRLDLLISPGVSRGEIETLPVQRRDLQLSSLAQQKLIDRMAPRAILIDRQYRILFISGDVNPYIKHKPGVPNDDLLSKLRDGMRSSLRGAVRKVFEENSVVRVTCGVEREGLKREVLIEASLIQQEGRKEELILIVFEESPELSSNQATPRRELQPAPKPQKIIDTDIDENAIIRQLEDELSATREDLQTTIEQFAASNEEFKASNEEVMSINEELQSTNEELETSKEELQSLNEELSTVNLQLASKVDELEVKHADLENLIAATEVATICLDSDMKIRWFTPAAQQVIRIKPSDQGRPLDDLQDDFTEKDLIEKCEKVLKHMIAVDNEVECQDGRAYIRRILPYRTDDHRIGGVVITCVEITARRKREQELLTSQAGLQELTETLESQVKQRMELLEILQYITRVANEGQNIESAFRSALKRISDYNGWRVGHVWQLDHESAHQKQAVLSSGIWYCDDSKQQMIAHFDEFRNLSQNMHFMSGEGMIGKIMETGEPVWITDISQHPDSWERHIPNLGLHAVIAFPITVAGKVVAVLEFFSEQTIKPQPRFLEIMPDIGIQLGHMIERKRLEQIAATIALEEQRRIGRELHEGIAQQLTGGALIVESLRADIPQELTTGLENLKHLTEILHQTHDDVRRLLSGLMSETVDAVDLIPTLRGLAAEVTERYEVQCKVFDDEYDEDFLTNDLVALTIYQVAKEAIHNAVKHADSPKITVNLSTKKNLLMMIEDDGSGFDLSQDGLDQNGLRIMRYRAESVGGELEVESVFGDGSIVKLTIPAKYCRG